MPDTFFRTIIDDIPVETLGLVLPHEHLFTDLRGPDVPDYAKADPARVAATMIPYLRDAEKAGVTALVECSTMGVGRNIEILTELAKRTQIHVLAPTGVYKESYTPAIYKSSSIEEMAELWVLELTEGIGMTGKKAGFIKIALSDDGPTALETRNIRAAVRASQATGAAIASHTIGGNAALKELAILEEEGLALERFIWVHANSEPDQHFHLEAASRGAYVEFDSIGQPGVDQEELASAVMFLIEEGFANHVLLSHDAGWFQPGNPGGEPEGGIRGYTALTNEFIPLLQDNGIDDRTISLLTVENPKHAFAITR